MKWALALLAVLALWQLARYGAFAPTAAQTRPVSPAPIITLFGASNFSRPPLADEIRALTGCEVRVIAKAGANSDWALTRPDAFDAGGLVIIAFTGNDAALHRGVPLSRSVANHRELLARAQRGDASVAHVIGGPRFHGPRGWVRPGARAYAAAVAALPGGVIDEGRHLPEGNAMPDGLHASPEAARHIARAYAEAIRPCCPHPRSGSCP